MSFDYSSLKATAESLIDRFGQDGQIVTRGTLTGPGYDPTFGPDTVQACRVVIQEYSLKDRESALIEEGDMKLLISTRGISAPDTADRINVAGQAFEVVRAMTLNPGGTELLHKVQGRRG